VNFSTARDSRVPVLPPSTDPRRFQIGRRTRDLVADGVEPMAAREIAEYRTVDEPSVPVRQAGLYEELKSEESWPYVRDCFAGAGIDTRVRCVGEPVADVPTVEQLYHVYMDNILPLLYDAPDDPALPDLAYAVHDSLENRRALGVVAGLEDLLSEYLVQSLDALFGLVGCGCPKV